ncbi:prepilin-type N-terminal cleavage/methylation domain-containing protein [Chryseomicrobium palamuruense]
MWKNQLRNRKGVTLIELLATLVLVSIISIFAISLITSSLNSYRTNQLNSELRTYADLLFLQTNNEVIPIHFTQIKDSSVANKNTKLTKLTISTASYFECPEYKSNNIACTQNQKTLEFKEINNKLVYFAGNQVPVDSNTFSLDESSGFYIDPTTKLVNLKLVVNYTFTRGNKSENKQTTFTQEFNPI